MANNVIFDDLINGRRYFVKESDDDGGETSAGRLYKIANYSGNNYVKTIHTRTSTGRSIYMETIYKVIPGTIFTEDDEIEDDPELADPELADPELDFLNVITTPIHQ